MDQSNKRLLLIEDSKFSVKFIRTLLNESTKFKYSIRGVETLEQSLAALETEVFDLILLDLGLPDSKGLETLRKVKYHCGDVPIIVQSAGKEDGLAESCIREGAQDFIAKDELDFDRLIKSILYSLERTRIERNMRDSEQRYRNLFESSRDAIMILDDHGFIDCNEATLRMFGCKAKEYFIGRTPADFSPPLQENGSDSMAEAQMRISRALEEGEQFFEWTHTKLSGDNFRAEVLLSAVTLKDKLVLQATVRDISSRKEMEESLFLFKDLADHSNDSILIVDDNGDLQYMNAAAEKSFGYSRMEAGKMDILERVFGCDVQADYLERIMDHPQQSYQGGCAPALEVKAIRKNGESFPAEVLMYNFGVKGKRFVACIARDIKYRKIAEFEMAQDQKLKSIGSLAAGIAHEINTPTQFVSDNVRFLRDSFSDLDSLLKKYRELAGLAGEGKDGRDLALSIASAEESIDLDYLMEDIPSAIEQSLTGLERISSIVQAMKDFAHPELKERRFTSVNKLIESSATVAKNEWKYVSDLDLRLDPDMPDLFCQPGELSQVFLNMIINAADSIAEAVGDGSHGKGLISVSSSHDDLGVTIEIRDTGAGIPREIVSRIFDPFFTTKEVGKGTGQGLSLARKIIVEGHKGEIIVDSRPGEGTRFAIKLPLLAEEYPVEDGLEKEALVR